MEPQTPFSINVSESDGLPPTEIYLNGDDRVNDSVLDAETPAHANLSMKDTNEEASTLKHPRAPKNKKQAGPKKFTFEGLPSENSLIESRDEDEPESFVGEPKEDLWNDRESSFQNEQGNELEEMEDECVMTPEEVEHQEGAYWFTECGVPDIDVKNSFPTVPFDEDPLLTELNLFCNRPPATLTPLAPGRCGNPMADTWDLEPLIEGDGESDRTQKSSIPQDHAHMETEMKQKVVSPPVSPKTAAVMSMPENHCFEDGLELAPSDELENRGSMEESPDDDDDDDVAMDEGDDGNGVRTMKEDEREKAGKRQMAAESIKHGEPLEATKDESKDNATSQVISPSNDSDELLEPVPQKYGELRGQLDQLRVSEALEAMTQTFNNQHFLGTELCGPQIMDWFGSRGDS